MADDWDEEPSSNAAAGSSDNYQDDGGVSFGRGRGYTSRNNGFDEETNGDGGYRRGRGGRGGRGGGGRGRGGGEGRGGGGEGRGGGDRRGGRGGGRGGRSHDFNGNADGDNNDDAFGDADNAGGEPEKPKERYVPTEKEDAELFGSGITAGINFKKYANIDVKVTGDNVPPNINSFKDSGLRDILVQNILHSGYTEPTPIQKHGIPVVMGGRDLMACAQTGSGKTAAFLLPILHAMLADPQDLVIEGNHVSPQAVIVSPTRELAIQIYNEARKFAMSSIIKVCILYGGTATYHQRNNLMRGCHILVATPGRMCDFMEKQNLTLEATRFMVLDEADRMLDMGFLPKMEEIMNHATMTPVGDRQTLMFSATFPEEIQLLAAKFLHNYVFVAIGIVGGANTDVEQVFHELSEHDKRLKLAEIIKENPEQLTLVFVETKRNADFIAIYLNENDFPTTSIHGDRLQREREEALRDFKTGRTKIMVATGVAARGLDIPGVQHVINFDLPKSIDEYVHRIGRTGRVGNRGKATSFYVAERNGSIAPALSRILKQAGQEVPAWLAAAGSGGGFGGRNNFGGEDVRGNEFGVAQDYSKRPADDADEEW